MEKITVRVKFWFDEAEAIHEINGGIDSENGPVAGWLESWLDPGVERVSATFPSGHVYTQLNPSAPPGHKWAIVPDA